MQLNALWSFVWTAKTSRSTFFKISILKWLKLGPLLSKMQICSFPYFLNLTVRNLSRRNDSSDTTADEQACSKNWLGSTWLLVVARHHACSRRNAFTWADNLIIMLMQFYSEFHKVSKGYRPLHGLHKQVYKARQTARFRLLSVTGQQQQCRPSLPNASFPPLLPFTIHYTIYTWSIYCVPMDICFGPSTRHKKLSDNIEIRQTDEL